MTLPLSGNFSVSTATYSCGRSLTMRFFSRAIRKPRSFFLRNLRFSTPEYQLFGANQGRAQPPAEHLLDHLPKEFILGLALGLVHHPEVDGHADASPIG